MNTYIICYDLKFPGGDYQGVEQAIKALPLTAILQMGESEQPEKYQMTTWVVETNQDSGAIFDKLSEKLRPKDKLLVAEIGFGWTSHMPEEQADSLPLPAWWSRYPYQRR